jgi:hypothetical protein
MTLYKQVNGERIPLTEQEETNTRAYWDLNNKYGIYTGSIAFDGINPPFVIIEQARVNHMEYMQGLITKLIEDLNKEIEIAQEDGLDTSLLFGKRKTLRAYLSMDLSTYNTLDELIASVPEELKIYWQPQA